MIYSPINQIKIFTDGACNGNPGSGGWAAIIRFDNIEKEISGGEYNTTNNRMEMLAVINSIQILDIDSTYHIDIYTDSCYVINGITKWIYSWKQRKWKKSNDQPVKNVDLWKILYYAIKNKNYNIRWHWIKGHTGIIENERCDLLAKKAIPRSLVIK